MNDLYHIIWDERERGRRGRIIHFERYIVDNFEAAHRIVLNYLQNATEIATDYVPLLDGRRLSWFYKDGKYALKVEGPRAIRLNWQEIMSHVVCPRCKVVGTFTGNYHVLPNGRDYVLAPECECADHGMVASTYRVFGILHSHDLVEHIRRARALIRWNVIEITPSPFDTASYIEVDESDDGHVVLKPIRLYVPLTD